MKLKKVLKKPNQLIEIKGKLSITQMKMYNSILFEIHKLLQGEKNKKTEFIFNYKKLKELSGVKTTSDTRVRTEISKIKNIEIEYTDTKRTDWGAFNLISAYSKKGDDIILEIPNAIQEALIKHNYFTQLDFLVLGNFESKFSILLYEIASKYNDEKIKIPKYQIDDFKALMGVENSKSYNNFGLLRKKVIDVAINEINSKSDLLLNYKEFKRGKKVESILFEIDHKTKIQKVTIDEKVDKIIDGNLLNISIANAKKNIYVSSSWNKRVDNKIKKIADDFGEEFTINLLKELYINLKQEVQVTLVQYINGMLKNMKEDVKDKEKKNPKPKRKKIEAIINDLVEIEEKEIIFSEEQIQEAIKKCVEVDGIDIKFLENMRKKSERVFINTIKKYVN